MKVRVFLYALVVSVSVLIVLALAAPAHAVSRPVPRKLCLVRVGQVQWLPCDWSDRAGRFLGNGRVVRRGGA